VISTLTTVRDQLCPDGILRAGLNLSNSLLVSGRDELGDWEGVAPDLARVIASALDATVEFVAFDTPAEVAAGAETGAWSIAMIGADPARMGTIAFTDPYAQIEAGYLVPPGSSLQHIDEVDRPGLRIAAFQGSAYGLWLERNLHQARLIQARSFDEAFSVFRAGESDVLASLMMKLRSDAEAWPGARILEGSFMTVNQAVATISVRHEAVKYLRTFVREACSIGLIDRLIARHGVMGLNAVSITDGELSRS
jgi:polar amino acid transport system substrate-binding protein